MWFSIAESGGNADAKKHRPMIEKEMTPLQLEAARKLAAACIKRKYKGCGEMAL
jgi:hypothetical protein